MSFCWRSKVLTLFPEIFPGPLGISLAGQAIKKNLWSLETLNLREYGIDGNASVDDTPFGGGPGMVMMAEPLFKAIDFVIDKFCGTDGMRILYPSPQGAPWTQSDAEESMDIEKIIIICGHYKGVDQRVIDKYVTHEYSMGDFVLSCGEIPALMIVDSIVRLLPGVLNDINSSKTDTFSSCLLYTSDAADE